jgi:DNA-binding MarR family transcriptional regulator
MSKPKEPEPNPGRFAYDGLDRVIHEKARLGILTSLMASPKGLLFGELKSLCALTDGNLSRHLQILEEAKLIEVWKGYKDRRPQTLCRISPAGKQRFRDYLGVLEAVLADALPDPTPAPNLLDGWTPA